MNSGYYCVCVIVFLTLLFEKSLSEATQKCYFSSGSKTNQEQLMNRIAPLMGQRFHLNDNGVNLSVGICTNVSDTHTNASIVQQSGNSSYILGRYNESDIMGSDNWVMLTYGSGDPYNKTDVCNGTRRTSILIYCNPEVHEPILKFMEHNQRWKNGGCFYMIELAACSICPGSHPEGLSRGSVFCIIFFTSVGAYLIIGICYRRLVKGAKGFEQLPHHRFWTRLGNLQADGCNLVCRREEEESWQRLTSSIKDMQDDHDDQDDQDEALLRP